MSTHEVFVQQFARLFHHYQEALSPASPEPDGSASQSWKMLRPDERNRMVAAARLAIMEMETDSRADENSRQYFAKPGECEWGC